MYIWILLWPCEDNFCIKIDFLEILKAVSARKEIEPGSVLDFNDVNAELNGIFIINFCCIRVLLFVQSVNRSSR